MINKGHKIQPTLKNKKKTLEHKKHYDYSHFTQSQLNSHLRWSNYDNDYRLIKYTYFLYSSLFFIN